MEITKKDIQYVAKLARLELSNEEIEDFRKDMSQIIKYVDKLNQLKTDDTKAASYVQNTSNIFREDVVEESSNRDDILKNAPSKEDGYINVPNVVKK